MAAADIVSALYTSVLGRPVDAEGLAYFTDALNRGATPEQVRQALATSPESQANVSKIFTQSLQRAATPSDVQYFTNAIAGGGLLSDVQRDVQASTEAQGLLGTVTPPVTTPPVVTPVTPGVVTPPVTTPPVVTPVTPGATKNRTSQVNALFQRVFGRDADPEGLAYWSNVLDQGASDADVEAGLKGSDEYINLTKKTGAEDTKAKNYTSQVNALFQKVFGRDADPEGLAYWSNVFAQGGSAADIEAGLRGSDEYKKLNPDQFKTTDYTSQVNALFRKVFGRDADPTGMAYWSKVFAGGASAADIEAGLRGSQEYIDLLKQSGDDPAALAKGIRAVPFGSQLINGRVQQVAQYGQPGAAQTAASVAGPSLQSFLAGTPGAAALSPFQQQMQYQSALPGMVRQFNPADIPRTIQQALSPGPRLDISQTTIPGWLQTAIDAQRSKDGAEITDQQKFVNANQVSTNSGLTPVVKPPVVTPPVVTPPVVPGPVVPGPVVPGPVVPPTVIGTGAVGQMYNSINSIFKNALGRDVDPTGFTYFANAINNGGTLADVERDVRASEEAQKRAGGNGLLSGNSLLTTNTTANTGNITGTGTTGATGGLLAANQISPQILGLYPEYLGRSGGDIDLPGASYWQGLANQGTPMADIIAGISGSKEGLLYAPTRAARLAAAAAPVVTNYNE